MASRATASTGARAGAWGPSWCSWSGRVRLGVSRRSRVALSATSGHRNYYELLEVDVHASEEDIKAAFRRKAKELHPDVNKAEEAERLFMEVNTAYETLSDSKQRSKYDRIHQVRRMNFFLDVEEGEDDWSSSRTSPFRWSHVGAAAEGGSSRSRWPGRPGDDNDDDSDEDEAGAGKDDNYDAYPNDRLKELLQYMWQHPDAPLQSWQRGRMDPWGTSTSQSWYQQVDSQTKEPFYRRNDYETRFGDGDRFQGPPEWMPGRRGDVDLPGRQGWQAPGQGTEWHPPRRGMEHDPDQQGRGPPPGRRGAGGGGGRWGGNDGFGGRPL